MSPFRRGRDGVPVARLSARERAVLRDVLLQVRELVGGPEEADPFAGLDPDTPAYAPEDPALARLFPDAYAEADAAREFRRYSEADLRAGKVRDALSAVADLDAGGPLRLPDPERAEAWLRALNDARLALGAWLEVGEDSWEELERLPRDSERRAALRLYHWLGWMQESLLDALPG